jgi:GTP-binding protein EngB required for normal cell division
MNAAQTMNLLRHIPFNKSVMLVAKHGVGKSSVVKQVAQEMGINFFDVRLSQCEVGDIKGLPRIDEVNDRTLFSKPYWWPRDPNSKGFLFFDELNRASKDVLQAVFEICLDRRLDGEKLPDGWRVVAAINGDDDYDVIELDPALMDRWFVIDFDPSSKEWIAWGRKNGVHAAVLDFINQNGELLDPPVGSLEAGRVYPSRRSWVSFHETASALGLWENKDGALLTQIASGWLGREIAAMFPKFFENEFSRLSAEDVLDNFDSVKEKIEGACSDIEVIAALARSVILEAINRKADKLKEDVQGANLKKFLFLLPKDVGSNYWKELLSSQKTKKLVLTWQEDPMVSDYIRQMFCR